MKPANSDNAVFSYTINRSYNIISKFDLSAVKHHHTNYNFIFL